MKTRFVLLLCLALTPLARADEPAAPALVAGDRLTADQLEQLVGPIALYPDALIALMLPAATAPADVVLAARYLKDDGNPEEVSSRSWDESVKSLVHYGEVVKWMDDNLSWTKQLGDAFGEQPAEVMQAIQRLRAKARAAGTLTDSPQQQVVIDSDVISIIPAQANYIYVPYYDPLVVYAPRPEYYSPAAFLSFSSPFAVGSWLRFDCDWRQRTVWTVDRHWTSRDHHDWRHPVFPGQPGYVNDPGRHPWRPANTPRMPIVNAYRRSDLPHPAPINAPQGPTYAHDNNPPDHRNDPRDRPQLTDARPRDPNFVGPVVAPTPAPNAPIAAAALAPTPSTMPSNRRPDPGRVRTDPVAPPSRAIAFQNPSVTQPVAQAPQPASNYPYGAAPASRVVPAFTGPVVSAMPLPAATPPQHLHMPAAAPAPTPAPVAPPPAQPQSDAKRGVNDNGDQKKQLN